jgi:hypothetical protein
MADRVNSRYQDIFLADLQSFLPRTVADDLGTRRVHAQVFERKIEFHAVLETHDEQSRVPAQGYFAGRHYSMYRLRSSSLDSSAR